MNVDNWHIQLFYVLQINMLINVALFQYYSDKYYAILSTYRFDDFGEIILCLTWMSNNRKNDYINLYWPFSGYFN